MNKVLSFVVLVTFIFSSCASAPVINHSQKPPVQLRVFHFIYPHNGYTNNATLAFKDGGFHIDLKATDPSEGSGTVTKRSPAGRTVLIVLLAVGILGAGGYFLYDYLTNPDSSLRN